MVSSIEKSLKKMLKRIDAKVVLIVLVVIAVVVVMSKTVEGFDWSMADKGYCESSSIAGQGSSCQANFSGIAGLGGQWGDACRGRGNDTDSCDLTLDDLYSNYDAKTMDPSASSIAIAAQDSDLGVLTTTLTQGDNPDLTGDTKVCEYTTEVDLCGAQTKDTCESSGQGCSWRDCDALKTNSGNPFDGIKSVEEKRQLFKQLFNCWKKEHEDYNGDVISGAGYNTTTSMLRTPIPVLTGSASFATDTNFSLGSVTVGGTALADDGEGTIAASLFPQNWVDDMEDVIEECGYDYATDTKGAPGTGKVGFRLGSEHIPTGLQCLNYNEGLDSHCISIIKDQPLTGPGCGGPDECDDDVVCDPNHIPELGDIRNSGCGLDEQIAQVFSVLGRRGGNLSDAQRNQFAEFIMANTL